MHKMRPKIKKKSYLCKCQFHISPKSRGIDTQSIKTQ